MARTIKRIRDKHMKPEKLYNKINAYRRDWSQCMRKSNIFLRGIAGDNKKVSYHDKQLH